MLFTVREVEWIVRLIIAAVCGIIIGYERRSHAKAAGIRTHAVVACASALMMVISKYAFVDVLEMGLYPEAMKMDPSRIASGVVSGVGFLGAGLIFVNKKTVFGLTTAAGIWATCGIGMAIGSGLYVVGIAATLLLLFIQIALHPAAKDTEKEDAISQNTDLHQALAELEAQILQAEQDSTEPGKTVYTITVTTEKQNETSAEIPEAQKLSV